MPTKVIALWILVVTLSIDPTTYTVTFTPHPDNAEVHIVIDAATGTTPYLQHDAFPVDGSDSELVVQRRRLPRGSYTVWAGVYQWVNCVLTPVESIPASIIIHVP